MGILSAMAAAPTEVEVIRVSTKRESELALPVERYKKILRKAP